MQLDTELRIEQNKVLLPFITLKIGNKTIIIIGMLHVASRAYFEVVLSRLNSYESAGFKILYEDIESVPSASQENLDNLLKGLEMYGLYSQLSFIQPKTSWVSADVSPEEMVKNFPQVEDYAENMKNPEKYLQEILLPELRGSGPEIPNIEFVINTRNQSAVNAILKHIENGNVATYWGCAHMPGMIHLLEQSSFTIKSIEWIEAIDIEKISTGFCTLRSSGHRD
ncbi:hypothetical protein IPH92_02835 [Candidatus Kaiserbacteria bacterium]|nr:MAG: hypothetical protein IPH92_02835 [Candidatus Kaiserbacteria bacterium]